MALQDYGLTSTGFTRPTLIEIVDDVKADFISAFGQKLQVGDDTVAGQIASIFAERENELWKIAEAVYHSHTLSGAEGIYLNDLLGKHGIFRRAAQPSSGSVYIATDATCSNTEQILSSTKYNGENGKTYAASSDILVSERVGGLYIKAEDIQVGVYQFYIDNPDTGITNTFEFKVSLKEDTTNTPDPDSISLFFVSLQGFISGIQDGIYSSYCHSSPTYFKLGFQNDIFVGLPKSTKMYFRTPVGIRYTEIPVVCTENGLNALGVGGIVSMTPKIVGYKDILSPQPFYSGSDVESDASYRLRYMLSKTKTAKSTPASMVAILSEISGVEDVKIYENPTNDVAYSPAPPFTAMFVILGGDPSTIVKTLYANKPINVNLVGEYSEYVPTADGRQEKVGFTQAEEKKFSVKVEYTTNNNIPISSQEKVGLVTALMDNIKSYSIGDTIYVPQLISQALASITASRVKTLAIQIKKKDDGDETYTDKSVSLTYKESAVLLEEDIAIIQGL